MKQLLFLLLVLILFAAADCGKEGPNCHRNIYFKNASNDTVIIAKVFYYDTLCMLEGQKYAPGAEMTFDILRGCYEGEISETKKFKFYVIDPIKYNKPTVFYNCDSIEIKNKVLKKYSLKLSELQNMNWTVTYP